MTRARVQLDISARVPKLGTSLRAWPILHFVSGRHVDWPAGAMLHVTIADVIQSRRPKFGALYFVALVAAVAPTRADMIEKGEFMLIGNYRSAAERASLLIGEVIPEEGKDDGEQV